MNPKDTLSREQILAALARLDELLREKPCDIVTSYYKESLLPPKVRFFIEEAIQEMNS